MDHQWKQTGLLLKATLLASLVLLGHFPVTFSAPLPARDEAVEVLETAPREVIDTHHGISGTARKARQDVSQETELPSTEQTPEPDPSDYLPLLTWSAVIGPRVTLAYGRTYNNSLYDAFKPILGGAKKPSPTLSDPQLQVLMNACNILQIYDTVTAINDNSSNDYLSILQKNAEDHCKWHKGLREIRSSTAPSGTQTQQEVGSGQPGPCSRAEWTDFRLHCLDLNGLTDSLRSLASVLQRYCSDGPEDCPDKIDLHRWIACKFEDEELKQRLHAHISCGSNPACRHVNYDQDFTRYTYEDEDCPR